MKEWTAVGHACSNCGQTVECDINTDLYEAAKQALSSLEDYNPSDLSTKARKQVALKATIQAIAKAEDK